MIEGNMEIQDTKARLVLMEKEDDLVLLDYLATLDLVDPKVLKGRKEIWVRRANRVQLETEGVEDHRVWSAFLDPAVWWAERDKRVHQAKTDSQGRMVPKAFRGNKVTTGRSDLTVKVVAVAKWVGQGCLETKVLLDQRVSVVCQAMLALLGREAIRGEWGCLEHRAAEDPRDSLVMSGSPGSQVSLEYLDLRGPQGTWVLKAFEGLKAPRAAWGELEQWVLWEPSAQLEILVQEEIRETQEKMVLEDQGAQPDLEALLVHRALLVYPQNLSRMTLRPFRCLSIHILLIRERQG